LANSNEEGKTYIGPSLEPCMPPFHAPMMGARVCVHATYVAGAAATIRGARIHATWPCAPPQRGPALPRAPLGRARPILRVRPPCRARSRGRAHLSHPSAPLPCAPPEYKSHKLVVHSTTWASRPLTTKRWVTAGCLGGDHSFYIHSHSHALGCACMHVTFHVF
jgi:hypothetical protein